MADRLPWILAVWLLLNLLVFVARLPVSDRTTINAGVRRG